MSEDYSNIWEGRPYDKIKGEDNSIEYSIAFLSIKMLFNLYAFYPPQLLFSLEIEIYLYLSWKWEHWDDLDIDLKKYKMQNFNVFWKHKA